MTANASGPTDVHALPGGGELHRARGGFWIVHDRTGASVALTDADIREMYRLSCARVLFEAPLNNDGDLVRIEVHGPTEYRILTNSPTISVEWFLVDKKPSWSAAGAFVSRYSRGYACPDLAEPTGETLAEWRKRTGENGGIA